MSYLKSHDVVGNEAADSVETLLYYGGLPTKSVPIKSVVVRMTEVLKKSLPAASNTGDLHGVWQENSEDHF